MARMRRWWGVLWLGAAAAVWVSAVTLGAQAGAPSSGGQRPPGAAAGPAPAQGAAPGGGQQQEPKNLQVLPKDISHQQLGEIMQGFARGLGVGCDHCHMGESMESMDWASDDKDEKKNAREMIRMVRMINERVAALTGTEHPREQVTCETCHRGLAEPPLPLGEILAAKALAGGPDAALAEYNRLHVEAGDAGQYDFRERALNAAARRLRDEKRLPDAIALLRKNASLFPKSSEVAAMLGSTLAESGDTDAARAELQRALELDPNNRFAKGALDKLKTKTPTP